MPAIVTRLAAAINAARLPNPGGTDDFAGPVTSAASMIVLARAASACAATPRSFRENLCLEQVAVAGDELNDLALGIAERHSRSRMHLKRLSSLTWTFGPDGVHQFRLAEHATGIVRQTSCLASRTFVAEVLRLRHQARAVLRARRRARNPVKRSTCPHQFADVLPAFPVFCSRIAECQDNSESQGHPVRTPPPDHAIVLMEPTRLGDGILVVWGFARPGGARSALLSSTALAASSRRSRARRSRGAVAQQGAHHSVRRSEMDQRLVHCHDVRR